MTCSAPYSSPSNAKPKEASVSPMVFLCVICSREGCLGLFGPSDVVLVFYSWGLGLFVGYSCCCWGLLGLALPWWRVFGTAVSWWVCLGVEYVCLCLGLGVVFFSFWPSGADMLPSSQQVLICFPTAYCFPNASCFHRHMAMFIGTFMLLLTPIVVFLVAIISNCYYPSFSGPRVEVLLLPWLWGHRGGLWSVEYLIAVLQL
ncbi:hypothetical protein U1Q18_031524, partial [Sarracenia purpurea var. burkii]